MYIPGHFREKDIEKALDFARENNFAILCTLNSGKILATHIPVLIEKKDNEIILSGHIARENRQQENYSGEALVIFSGPHSYISSKWYEVKNSVPTWNYLAAHFYGEIKFIHDKKENELIIRKTLKFFEGDPGHDEQNIDERYFEALLDNLTSFRIDVKEIEFKKKLSQNKSKGIRERVISKLEAPGDENKNKIAELMKKNE
jgi:transcriptional regulator